MPRSCYPSTAPESNPRAKSLSLHDFSLSTGPECNSPPKSHSQSENTHKLDSANLEAARRLYHLREVTGLTQAKVAALTGESVQQVRRREAGRVSLGPLRALVLLEREAAAKAVK